MRLGVHLGPFYASTSTRRRRGKSSSGGKVAAWVFGLAAIFWPLALGQKPGGGYHPWVWLIAVPWWILCVLVLLGIAVSRNGSTDSGTQGKPKS